MSPLAVEILKILESEADFPPMSGAKVVECLRVTGFGHGATAAEVENALAELHRDGTIEKVCYRGESRWRICRNAQVGGVKIGTSDSPMRK